MANFTRQLPSPSTMMPESDLPPWTGAEDSGAAVPGTMTLSSKDRDGLTLDVAMALSAAKVKVSALSARSQPDGHATVNIVVEVKDKEELTAVIGKLNNIQGVYYVARASGK